MENERMISYVQTDTMIKRDRIFFNNPVVMQGLGLAPLIVAASSLNNAMMLSTAVLLILTPTRMLAAFLTKFSFFRFRGFTYAISAGIVYLFALYLLREIYSQADLGLLGLYLPLLCADPIILKRYERPQRERINTAFKKGVITSIGYILAVCLVGTLRELLALGTVLGRPVLSYAIFPIAGDPMGGFIVLSFVIAIWRGFVHTVKQKLAIEVNHFP